MQAKLEISAENFVEFDFDQDDIWPWPIYEIDVVKKNHARSSGTSAENMSVVVLGKKSGSGTMSIIAIDVHPDDVDKIIGWANNGSSLTLTLPGKLFQGEDRTFSVKIAKSPRGKHLGGGTGYYNVPLEFIYGG